jgi:pSer/pThr/pTyr-binding forkhead associated (FHA) protein
MNKCPHCGAETRPGDPFCLSCGNRLFPATPAYAQAQPVAGDATLPAQDEWGPAQQGSQVPSSPSGPSFGASWSSATVPAASQPLAEMSPVAPVPPIQPAQPVQTESREAAAAPPKIEKPALLILRSENGEVIQEYTLDKPEISIGRAPNNDILLSKDKLTSRRHATIRYENDKYVLRDERSANGTFVNNQQLEELVPYELQDGDHIAIGEYELIFRLNPASVADLPTINISPVDQTYETRGDSELTKSVDDRFTTRDESQVPGATTAEASAPTGDGNESKASVAPVAPIAAEPAPPPVSSAVSTPRAGEEAARTVAPSEQATITGLADGVTFSRLTSLPLPTLPDMSSLMAALATLDGQVSALQERLNATQEALRNHEAEIAQTANQLRAGVRKVAEHMDQTIADVARSREALAWSELIQLMDDVTNNPRDIEYVTRLARKARELNKVFQIHQSVLNTLAECNTLLRALIGEER